MYIMSQNGEVTVNSATLSSVEIRPTKFTEDDLQQAFPEPYAIVAYGSGKKEYPMGIYADREEALELLGYMHNAMGHSEKTFEFWQSFKVDEYCRILRIQSALMPEHTR